MVSDIQYRDVPGHIFFSDHSDFGTSDPKDKTEYCLDDPKRTDIFGHGREFAYDPFHQKNGDGEDQISDHHDTDENKSYHY